MRFCLFCGKVLTADSCPCSGGEQDKDSTIAALRAEVEHVNAANQSMLLVIEKQNRNATALRAEVERLKAALQEIASCDSVVPGDTVDIARKALECTD